MKPELMKNWHVVQNGRQLDIHARDYAERREITVVADVRDEACANLIANAPKYAQALEKIAALSSLADAESADPRMQEILGVAMAALGPQVQAQASGV